VNGLPNNAVIIFANQKLAGQSRANSNPSNYLEGNNLPTFNTGAPGYQTAPVSGTFNDILFCVQTAPSPAISCP
jgi:hypothetical protein